MKFLNIPGIFTDRSMSLAAGKLYFSCWFDRVYSYFKMSQNLASKPFGERDIKGRTCRQPRSLYALNAMNVEDGV
jgi:hypothetical protein